MSEGEKSARRALMAGKQEVPPSGIRAELERIRREAAVSGVQQNAKPTAPRARVTLANLILLVSDTTPSYLWDAIEGLISELCVSYPSRFFIIEYDSSPAGPEGRLQTAVSSRCVRTNSGVEMCSEEVYIRAQPDTSAFVPNLLLSLFVSDIDASLLVLSDPARELGSGGEGGFRKLLQGLAHVCDQVVYDSVLFADYKKSVDALFAARPDAQQDSGENPLRRLDLAWRRGYRWRTLLAEQFDSEQGQQHAEHIAALRIGCRTESASLVSGQVPSDGLLFAGWFLSALGWEPQDWSPGTAAEGVLMRARDSSGTEREVCFVPLTAQEGDARPSSLRSIELQLDGGSKLKLKRRVKQCLAEVSSEAHADGESATCEFSVRSAPFLTESFESIVINKIGNEEVEREFLRALAMSRRLAEVLDQ